MIPALFFICAFARANVLVDFSTVTHSIPVVKSAAGNPAGAIAPGKFYNFDVTKLRGGDWSGFDQLQLTVTNPTQAPAQFFLTVADANSQDYWTKLNHKTTLAPGPNLLTFSLTQSVGERGSHRHQRGLDLKKLAKFFIHVEGPATRFLVDDIRLVKKATLNLPKGMTALDFTVDTLSELSPLLPVLQDQTYATNKGFGFLAGAKFWRSEDAIYAPASLRGTIGVLAGSFRVDLPNGRYRGELIWNRLGYWDPSFWKRRYVQLNQKPLRLETRLMDAYLKDLLRFQDPASESQSLYDALFAKLFAPLEFEVEVTKGHAIFEFEGDPTGVSLNRLLLWPEAQEKAALSFREELRGYESREWQREARRISRPVAPLKSVGVVSASTRLSPQRPLVASSQLSFEGGKGSRPQQVLQLPAGTYSWSVSQLSHISGERAAAPLELSLVQAHDVSIDMNHETYERVGKTLVPVATSAFTLTEPVNYLWLTLPVDPTWKAGRWTGSVKLLAKATVHTIPLTLQVHHYQLPRAPVSAGFFHLTPLPHPYFEDVRLRRYQQQIRVSALKLMARFGFTAFSGLPDDEAELSEVLKTAGELGFLTAYTYGGPYLARAGEIPEREAEILNQRVALQNKKTPKIVLTFSDEPTGYQNRLAADTELRKRLRKLLPDVPLSAFSSMAEEATDAFNQSLNVGLYTKADTWKLKMWQRQGHQWGAYNGAPGNFDDPRFGFGVGLFLATRAGLTHYLEWQSVNNFPYLELDGREGDVTAWLPLADGSVRPTVRFMLAAQGLETYRKLLVVAARAEKEDALGEELRAWLESVSARFKIFQSERLLKNESFSPDAFERELNEMLKKII